MKATPAAHDLLVEVNYDEYAAVHEAILDRIQQNIDAGFPHGMGFSFNAHARFSTAAERPACFDAESLNECLRQLGPLPPQIHTSEYLVEQFRFPKSKKQRIRKKWAQRPENFRPARHALHDQVRGRLYIHPEMLALARAAL